MELTINQALRQGFTAHKEGKLQEAERLYRAVLQAQPNHPDANHNLGVLAVSVNKSDAALPFFKAALEANPKLQQFWISYIDALITQQQFDDATQVLEKAKKQGLDGRTLNAIADALNAARPHLKNELLNEGELSPAINLREAGKYHEAQKWLNKFIQTHPSQPQALSLLSQVLLLGGKDMEAEERLLEAASMDPHLPSIHLNQARLLLKRSKLEEALEKAQAGYRLSSTDPESWLVLAACLGANNRGQDALAWIQKALVSKPEYAEAFANKALIKLRSKDLFGAIKDAEIATFLKPHLTQTWKLLGTLRSQTNNLAGAVEALEQARKIKPTDADILIILGEFLRQDSKVIEAISVLEEATNYAPENANTWINLGTAFQQEKQFEKARNAYKEALVIKPELAEAYMNLGITQHELGRLHEAEASCAQAITLKPEFAMGHNSLAVTLRKLGRLKESEASYKKAIALKPDFAEAQCNLGNILKEMERFDEAEASYSKSLNIMPSSVGSNLGLGTLYKQKGEMLRAIENLRNLLIFEPNYNEANYLLGHALELEAKYQYSKASKRVHTKSPFHDVNRNINKLVGNALETESKYQYSKAFERAGTKSLLDDINRNIRKLVPKEIKIDRTIIESLNKISRSINQLYGFCDIRSVGEVRPSINCGPCGPFAHEFYMQWNSRFINKVKMAFIINANTHESNHVLIQLPNNMAFDGGNGVHDFNTYKENGDLIIMEKYELDVIDKLSWGLIRAYPDTCPNFSIRKVSDLIARFLDDIHIDETNLQPD